MSGLAEHSSVGAWSIARCWPSYSIDVFDATTPRLGSLCGANPDDLPSRLRLGVFKAAPNPNAARLFQCYCFAAECQQLVSGFGGLRSFHLDVKEKAAGRSATSR
jgi:hypothetical protein